MKVAKVNAHTRYAAWLNPAYGIWFVVREVLDKGQWVRKPGTAFRCVSKHEAEQKVDRQAALERHVRREIEACRVTQEAGR